MYEALQRMATWLGTLKASEWMGFYGAALSTALAISKGWFYFRGPRSIVQVVLEVAEIRVLDEAKTEQLHEVTVVNRSTHAVTVTALEALAVGPKPRWFLSPHSRIADRGLPFDVAPRSSWHVAFTAYQFVGQDGIAFQRVAARLATGERVKSNRVKKRSAVLDR